MQDHRALPEKKYFKIGEVADLVGVEPHVLRYWETQFPQLRPHKARSGHRLYRRREVESLLVIRELLHVQRFTIAGARQALRQPGGAQALLPRFFEGASGRGPSPARVDVDERSEDKGAVAQESVEVEAQGLHEDELRDALERQAAEQQAEHGVVEVEVELARPAPVMSWLPSLSLSKRALLEDALLSARAVLSILDREAHRQRPQA